MTKKTNESESLGTMVARMRSDQIKRDWNKLTPAEKTAKLKKDQEDTKKRMAEGKNHTWKSEGHYTKDGKEWSGPQHAHDGQVMTGEKHTADSQNLYHFKELSPEVKKKVLEKMKMSEGIVNAIMKSKTLNKKNYAIAAKELDKKVKKDPSKTRSAHAHDVSRYVKGVDARKLAAEENVDEAVYQALAAKPRKINWTADGKDADAEKKKVPAKPKGAMKRKDFVKHLANELTAAQKADRLALIRKAAEKRKAKKGEAEKENPTRHLKNMQKKERETIAYYKKHTPGKKLSTMDHIGRHDGQKAQRNASKSYDNPRTAAYLARHDYAEVEMTGCPLLEKLSPSDGIGTYIKDFKKSDAPQFKGASASKRRKMAVAAYLGAKRKKMSEGMAYDSTMGVMDRGLPKGTTYMKDNTPGESQEACHSCEGAGCSHCNYRGTHSRKIEAQAKFAEETEAGETKKKYREDNADIAPEAGIVPLSKDDLAHLSHEIETMTEDDMEEYGFFDDEDDEYDSTVDWDDFDFEDVDIVDTDYKVTTSEGVEHIFTLDEVLSVQGRLKRRFAARKNKQKLRVARNIALRRGSSPARLKKRATRGARNMVYKRLLKGRDKSSMPPAEKARFERLIGMYQPLIQRFAQRMLPQMRKMEITRMKNRSGKKPQKSKKYKVAKPVRSGTTQKAKKFKVKKR